MKRSMIRRGLATVVAGTLALTMAACSGGAKPGETTGGGAGGGATAWALTGGSEQMFKTSFDSWNTSNPNEKIDVQWFANDAFKEKIRTAVGSGNAPTLIYSWAGSTLADYVAAGKVVDITEQTKPLLQRVVPSVAQSGMIDGKVYAVPNTQSQPVVLYYNKAVLAKAGVAVPTTYAEMLAAVGKLKAAGVIPIALAGQSVWPELMWLEYMADRVGGPDAFDAVLAGKKGAWSSPAMLEALTKLQELVDAGAFGDSFGSVVADNSADTALVTSGKAAMVLQGSWVYPNMQTAAPDFVAKDLGYANFPAVDGGKGDAADIAGNASNFWSVSASATPAQQATATAYLSKMVLSDDSVSSLLSIGTVPPIVGLESKIAATDNATYLGWVYGMVRDAPHFQLSWDQALPAAQGQAMLDNLGQLFLKQITPQQFADTMNATLS